MPCCGASDVRPVSSSRHSCLPPVPHSYPLTIANTRGEAWTCPVRESNQVKSAGTLQSDVSREGRRTAALSESLTQDQRKSGAGANRIRRRRA